MAKPADRLTISLAQMNQRVGDLEGNAQAIDCENGDIAPSHGESAMRQINEVHQSQRDREPGREHEQQHAIGNSIE